MAENTCDLCGSARRRKVYDVRDTNYGFPGAFTIVQCDQCRLVFLNSRPAGDELASYYSDETYHPFKAMYRGEAPLPSDLQFRRAGRLSGRQRAEFRQPGTPSLS